MQMAELAKTKCLGRFWDNEGDYQDPEGVEIEVGYDGETFYIDGLREGKYLSIPLHAIAQAMADETRPREAKLAS
jgi:hypothetical protein